MNKVLIVLGVIVVLVVAGLLIVNPSNDYEVIIVDEVEQLEVELTSLDVAVRNGTLTPEQATSARVRIENQLSKISASMNGATAAKLTEFQKAQLQEGLSRLQEILLKYQSTLVTVDTEASKDTSNTNRRSGGLTLTSKFVDIIGVVESTIEDVDDDYVADEALADAVEEIDEEAPDTVEELIEAAEEAEAEAKEVEDDMSSSTDETVDDEAIDEPEDPDEVSVDAEAAVEGELEVTQ